MYKMINNNYAIILAGGIGSRFWPISKVSTPKQFIDFGGDGETLIQKTFVRLKKVVPVNNIFISTNDLYRDLVLDQLSEVDKSHIIIEPKKRNTAPSILYASLKINKINSEARVIVCPSDHLISDISSFVLNVKLGFDFVAKYDRLLTFGVKPLRPETGFGYIMYGNKNKKINDVIKFVEKPSKKNAEQYLKLDKHLWNSGIFLWKVSDIIHSFKKYQTKMYRKISDGIKFLNTDRELSFINKVYPKIENISIDYAILEKSSNCSVLKVDFKWNDFGTWSSLFEEINFDNLKNKVVSEKKFLKNSSGNLIFNKTKKLVVLDQIKNLSIILTDDVLLIYPKGNDQELKNTVQQIKIKLKNKFT